MTFAFDGQKRAKTIGSPEEILEIINLFDSKRQEVLRYISQKQMSQKDDSQ